MDPLFLTPVQMAEFKISCRKKKKKSYILQCVRIKVFFNTLFYLPLSEPLCCERLP